MKAYINYKKCITHEDKCTILNSCDSDAITYDEKPHTANSTIIDQSKCVGCGTCINLCADNAIELKSTSDNLNCSSNNVRECLCPKTSCKNHGKCCDCVIKHKITDSLPYCLFPNNGGDKSIPNDYNVLKKRFEQEK